MMVVKNAFSREQWLAYKKIALLDQIQTKELVKELVIEIIDSRVAPTLSYIGIFE